MTTTQDIRLPRFVVFEGVDGSGKTALAHALARYYGAQKRESPALYRHFLSLNLEKSN